jgi:outer membrane protein insertion porin family
VTAPFVLLPLFGRYDDIIELFLVVRPTGGLLKLKTEFMFDHGIRTVPEGGTVSGAGGPPLPRLFLLILCLFQALASPARAETGDFAYTPLRIKDIRIYGNTRIRSFILRREIPFQHGDTLDDAKLAEARKRLRRVPGVDYSDLAVSYQPQDSSVSLTLIITERSTFNGRPLIQRGQQNKMSFGLELWDKNFRGRSETLSGFFLLRGNTMAGLLWENPWLGGGPRLGAGLDLWYKKYLYVYDDAGPRFRDASIEWFGSSLRLFYEPGRAGRITLAGGFETVQSPVAGMTVSDDRDTYAALSVNYRLDSRSDPVYPFDGVYVEAGAEEIGAGQSRISVHETRLDLRTLRSLWDRGIVAVQGRILHRDGDPVPLYYRQHLGGSRTLRGFDFGSFHGASSIVTSVEGRLPVNFSRAYPASQVLLGLAWHLFADAGMAWDRDRDLAVRNFHGSFGVGGYLFSKAGSGLRLDYGWRLDGPGRFELDIGMKF